MLFEQFKNKLIISCQALPDEPLHSPFIMGRMALAAKQVGAVAIRCQSVEDIKEIKKVTGLPVIGLIKQNYDDSEIYITPTRKEVQALIDIGCEVIALDATMRRRPGDEKLEDLVKMIKDAGLLSLADISNDEEAHNAEKIGFDAISTTLSGYTPYSPKFEGPDLGLVARLVATCKIPVFAEGRINTPADLVRAYEVGAYGAIVGSAITRPQVIGKWFIDALPKV
ncbi:MULTISPECIES: N-acetylmannosamine-6-phosphate 2-epimerase [unclassified Anaerobiospirillum]|uniref:N-acetylmannosamine-6-phosphate 2-epimerase n=1 Tax=unclassified Anaerobiospirillum TaxID=2647410 RepID=UPI001FF3F533|nr:MULTISPECIES: N-acetylmannosamine-6-phosphate 2-epimerase [unclassified Anaerobiospirillum]MCK0526200.1 N-acetylmannosamine-6-phosphate 2-epimerase [Anaerobiospirillum sp. NML120449]MCK0534937.1 N-acetylmannosamine-6-phosphate 2-epimerase [Anaerobiospirillum sp. NML120511]MCK0540378.1 N-acetylmannosamine-6-phosphate 2-epimerase [Anaerobiospirillum sp. NML02-A-032]